MRQHLMATVGVLTGLLLVGEALAQSTRINYGRITAVRQVDIQSQRAQTTGTVVGGLAGLATGSGQSTSNRALRTLGGAAAGRAVGGAMGSTTGFEYTVLIGGANTIQVVTEKAGLRVRDCVSVERGAFNNIRLVPDERCEAAEARPVAADTAAADACTAATQQLLDAQTDEEFDRAERRMRLLCD